MPWSEFQTTALSLILVVISYQIARDGTKGNTSEGYIETFHNF
jgi:hypothetical protein